MQITLLNSRHNSENFDIIFCFSTNIFTKFCGPKNSPVFGPPCIIRNVILILTVKKFENWSIFDEVIRHTKRVPICGLPCIFLARYRQISQLHLHL